MALATQCPYCRTTFRVAQDQLKLRAGLVRCGNCKEIFNGVEHLLRPEEPAQSGAPSSTTGTETSAAQVAQEAPLMTPSAAPTPSARPQPPANSNAPAAKPGEPEDTPEFIDFFDLLGAPAKPAGNAESPAATVPAPVEEPLPALITQDPVPAPAPTPPAPAADLPEDPLQRMTLMVLSEHEPQDNAAERDTDLADETDFSMPPEMDDEKSDKPDPIALAIEDLHKKPLRGTRDTMTRKEAAVADDDDIEEPSFVKSGRRRQRLGRSMRILMALASFVLLTSLLAQTAYIFRNQIAARLPQTKPLLMEACKLFACGVGLPAQIEAVSIESSELQTLASGKDTFVLTVLLRNHSQTVQAWPNIELTLNDSNEKAIARRVFVPRDYLPATLDAAKGIGPTSEQSIKQFFELQQLKAAGYRVYLFYP